MKKFIMILTSIASISSFAQNADLKDNSHVCKLDSNVSFKLLEPSDVQLGKSLYIVDGQIEQKKPTTYEIPFCEIRTKKRKSLRLLSYKLSSLLKRVKSNREIKKLTGLQYEDLRDHDSYNFPVGYEFKVTGAMKYNCHSSTKWYPGQGESWVNIGLSNYVTSGMTCYPGIGNTLTIEQLKVILGNAFEMEIVE
jgi:hypothetical protein